MSKLHFDCSATRHQFWFEENISGDMERVLQVAFHFVKDVFGSSTQQNGACLRIFTIFNEGKILITNLSHLKESGTSSNVILADLISTIDNGCAASTGYTQIVGFAQSSNH